MEQIKYFEEFVNEVYKDKPRRIVDAVLRRLDLRFGKDKKNVRTLRFKNSKRDKKTSVDQDKHNRYRANMHRPSERNEDSMKNIKRNVILGAGLGLATLGAYKLIQARRKARLKKYEEAYKTEENIQLKIELGKKIDKLKEKIQDENN